MIWLTFLMIPIVFLLLRLYRRKKFVDLMLSKFPSPPTLPLLGHVLSVTPTPPEIFKTFNGWIENYGKNFVFVIPLYEVLFIVSDVRDIEKILANPNSKSAQKADAYFNLEPWLGTGLLLSWGEKWFQRRKIITPTFHFNILEQFAEVMSKQSDVLVEKLSPNVNGDDIDIYQYTTLLALDVICETSMGVPINAQSMPNSEYVKAVKEMSVLFQKRFFSIFGQIPSIYNLTPNGKRETKLREILHGFTNKVILQRRDQLLNQSSTPQNGKTRMNFLDMLLNSSINGKPLSNADIREEVDTFMFEGHDTTTSGIAFTFYQLSQHEKVQTRLYEELRDILGDTDTIDITYQKLGDLRYLDMVVKESLRTFPPVPFIGRKLTEDTVLGGVNIPAGTNLSLHLYSLMHDSGNYSNPHVFDPERFDPSQTANRHPFSYLPFSAGARNCIGQKFALMEIKLAVSKVLMHYELLPSTSQKQPIIQGDIVLKSADGIRLRVANRKKSE